MKNIYIFLVLLLAITFSSFELSGVATGTFSVLLRPSHLYIKSDTAQGAVLVTLTGYSTNDVRYRLYSGGTQYNCWNNLTGTYITSTSYSLGPQVIGTPSTSATFWIVYLRGTNTLNAASYRDRIGPAYSVNNNTAALPSATAIADSFIISGKLLGSEANGLTQKYVVLAWNGATLVSVGSSYLNSGDYSIYLPNGTTIDKIEVRTLDNLSIYEVTGSWTTFTTLSDIQLFDSPTQDSKLSAINLDGSDLVGFSQNVTSYTVELPAGTIIIPEVTYTTSNNKATVQVNNANDLTGDEAARTTTIVVTAEDGTTTSTYKVVFSVYVPGTDAFLLNLFVNGAAIDGFIPGTFNYTAFQLCGVSSVPVVSYSASDTNATVTVINASNLNGTEEERTTTVLVTAEDGTTTATYKVVFTIYVPGTNATLIDFTIDGSTVDGFDPGTFEYDVLLPFGTTNVPTVTFIIADEKATAVIINASNINGTEEERTTNVMVTAEDGTTTATYKVVFSVYVPGTNASLVNFSINGSTVDNFTSGTFEYHVLLPFGTLDVPIVTYSMADDKATTVITNAVYLRGTEAERTTTVLVTAEDGITTSTYKVIFSVYIPGTDAFLLNLSVEGVKVDGFAPGTFKYSVFLPFGAGIVPTVTFSASDPKASISVTNASNINGTEEERTTTVFVTAEDGSTIETYSILFTVSLPGDDSFLIDLSFNGSTVAGFTMGTFEYAMILPYGTTTIPIVTYNKTDPKANAVVTNAGNLNGTESERTTTVLVTAEDGITTSNYKVVFSVYIPGTDAFLLNLSVDDAKVDGFAPGTFKYSVFLPYGAGIVPTVTFSMSDPKANAVVVNASNLHGTEEERTTTILVTAEDGIATKTYSIVFSLYVPGTNASLVNLSFDGSTVDGFTPGTFEYAVPLPFDVTAVPALTYATVDAKATAFITDARNLNGTEAERTTTVIVIAEDGTTTSTYKVVFSIYVPNTNASLVDLSVNGSTIDGFAPGTFEYDVLLPSGTTIVPTVAFTTAGANATVVVANASNINGTLSERTTTVLITAEDGTTTATYKVKFSVYVPATNAFLLNLSVNCTTVNGFDPGTFEYAVPLPFGATKIPPLTYTLADAKATAVVTNAGNLNGTEEERTTIIQITAEDGNTRHSYTIVFTVDDNSGIASPSYSGISIYPVPALNQLTIRGLANVNRLDIIDIKGKVVRKVEITGEEVTLNVSDLQNGIYFLRTESQTLKFIKE